MPKYYCDYCDIFLTHDSPSVRKAHNDGGKHKTAIREYYSQFLPQREIRPLLPFGPVPPFFAQPPPHMAFYGAPGGPPPPGMPGFPPQAQGYTPQGHGPPQPYPPQPYPAPSQPYPGPPQPYPGPPPPSSSSQPYPGPPQPYPGNGYNGQTHQHNADRPDGQHYQG